MLQPLKALGVFLNAEWCWFVPLNIIIGGKYVKPPTILCYWIIFGSVISFCCLMLQFYYHHIKKCSKCHTDFKLCDWNNYSSFTIKIITMHYLSILYVTVQWIINILKRDSSFERHLQREEALGRAGSLPKWLQDLHLRWPKSKGLHLYLGLPHLWRSTKYLGNHHMPSQVRQQGVGSEMVQLDLRQALT